MNKQIIKPVIIRLALLVIAIIFLYSCNHPVKTIKVDLDNSADTVSFHDIFERVDVIPLNIPKDIQLSNNGLYRFAYGNHSFAVLSCFGDYSILIFDYTGSFVKRINNQGTGAGLYEKAYDLLFDEEGEMLVVLDPIGKVIRYSKDDYSFIDEMSFRGSIVAGHYLGLLNDNCYIILSRSDKSLLHRCSFSEQTISAFNISCPTWLIQSPMMSYISPFFYFEGHVSFLNSLDGSLYSIGDHMLSRYVLGFWKLPLERKVCS